MSFSDLETLVGSYGSIFGNDPSVIFVLGLIILCFFMSFSLYLAIGFEATALIMCILGIALASTGLLPAWIPIVIFLGMAVVVKTLFTIVIERRE